MTSFLQSSLAGPALSEALQEIAEVATRDVVGTDSAAAVVHRGSDVVRACSGSLAAAVDTVQYETGQGPCLHAFHTGRSVLLDLGDGDSRWPTFQAAAEAIGAHTVLSLPLLVSDDAVGSLNLYSRSAGAFAPWVIRRAELFAQVSALRLSLAGFAADAGDAADGVGREATDRATIDQALGVLMERHVDVSLVRARRRLDRAAVDLGISAPEAAARILAAAFARGA